VEVEVAFKVSGQNCAGDFLEVRWELLGQCGELAAQSMLPPE